MEKVKDPKRRVTFLPVCEVREFGLTDVESDAEKTSTKESMVYAANWIQSIPDELNVTIIENNPPSPKLAPNASMIGLAGDSPTRIPMRSRAMRSRTNGTPGKLSRSPTWRVPISCSSSVPTRGQPIKRVSSKSPLKRSISGKVASQSPKSRPTIRTMAALSAAGTKQPSMPLKRQPRMGLRAVQIERQVVQEAAEEAAQKAAQQAVQALEADKSLDTTQEASQSEVAQEPAKEKAAKPRKASRSPSKAWNFPQLPRERHGWPTNAIQRNALFLKNLRNIREFEYNAAKAEKAKRRETHGIQWTKPTTLELIRMDWRFKDEMESGGENPGDNESNHPASSDQRKKKLLTVKERMSQQIARKKTSEERRDAAQRLHYFQEYFVNFLKHAQRGISLASFGSAMEDEPMRNPKFSNYQAERAYFVERNRRDPKKVDFLVRANIVRRLANAHIDRKVRIAYDVIKTHYDSVLGPHLYHFFKQKNEKHFEALERAFLLDK